MNTFQLEFLLKSNAVTRKVFCGVYAADELPPRSQIKKPILIVNTDPKSSPGEHWLVIYINKREIEIFDSSGSLRNRKNKYIKKYLKTNFPGTLIKYNTGCIQAFSSNICGIYCLVYAYFKAVKRSFEDFLKLFNPSNLESNDAKVIQMFKKYYKSKDMNKLLKRKKCVQISKSLILCKHLV